jgi:hypothetical protein
VIRALLVVLLLSIDGWGCAGHADDGHELCDEELRGWVCDETCGTCSCDGHVTQAADGRGECVL